MTFSALLCTGVLCPDQKTAFVGQFLDLAVIASISSGFPMMSCPAKRMLHQTVQRLSAVLPNGSTARTYATRAFQAQASWTRADAHRNLGSSSSSPDVRRRKVGFARPPVCLSLLGFFANTEANRINQTYGAHEASAQAARDVQPQLPRAARLDNPEALNALRAAAGPVSKCATCRLARQWRTRAHRGFATGPLRNQEPEPSQDVAPSSSQTAASDTMERAKDTGPTRSSSSEITIHFILRDGSQRSVKASVGASLLEIAHANQINVEGACEASLACSTCHVILDETSFNKLPDASEREEDLLDMAPHLSDTSRLSCQVRITPDLDGMTVRLPLSTLNFYVDGHLPAPH